MSDTTVEETLAAIAEAQAPVLERIVAMHLDSLEQSGLEPAAYHMVRLAALVAMDAAPVSYVIHVGNAAEAGVTMEQMQGVLVAIAPIVGSARVTSAAGKVLRGFKAAATIEALAGDA